jgi:NADH-quinone oxidoreductase subunit E
MTTNLTSLQPIPMLLREQPDFAVSPQLEAEFDQLITHYPHKRSASMMLLHAIQERDGSISRQAVEWIAAKLGLQPINVYELVTFYPMFQRKPLGKHHIKICRTLSCALAGSYELHNYFCKTLGLDAKAHGPQTTPDGKYTVEFVECLADCGKAPVMMINDEHYQVVSQAKAAELLKQCK